MLTVAHLPNRVFDGLPYHHVDHYARIDNKCRERWRADGSALAVSCSRYRYPFCHRKGIFTLRSASASRVGTHRVASENKIG